MPPPSKVGAGACLPAPTRVANLKPMPEARDPAVTSRIMASVGRRDSRAELSLRRALFAMGLRFRVDYGRLPGRPDIVFPSAHVAVFVDGDFWHGAGWRERGFSSLEEQFGERRDFWVAKIRRNMERDAEVNARLDALGWKVMRFFSSRVEQELEDIAAIVAAEVRRRRGSTATFVPASERGL